tara:strand:- start:189 stop:533 length:345 start_codon:yes stop_codon:yes gene_type:complete
MQVVRFIDIAVSFICACVAWQIMFGSNIPVESAVSALVLFPVLGFLGVLFELFKIVSFFVIFLSTMFVFEQLILIIRSIGQDYNDKMGLRYTVIKDISEFPQDDQAEDNEKDNN